MSEFYIFFSLLFFLNILIIFNIDKINKFVNIYDVPDNKIKLHKRKTAITGGLIILVNLLLCAILSYSLHINLFPSKIQNIDIFTFFIWPISLFALGFYDDKYPINPTVKLFLALVFIVIVILTNSSLVIESISLSFYKYRIFFENTSFIFTVFCCLIFLHAANMFDGINLQSILFFLLLNLFIFFKTNFFILSLFLFVVLLSLLILNYRNKTFLGDGGIYALCSIYSFFLLFQYNNIGGKIPYADEIFIILMLPGFDLLRVSIERLLKKTNPFLGDRNHIHHLLVKRFSIIKSNVILFTLMFLPITLYNISDINGLFIIMLFFVVYIVTVVKLR